jgi:preprotein translocase subunit SecG
MRLALMVGQVLVSLVLIASILLQSGKSAGLSGSISGGAEQLMGRKGKGYESLLNKATTVAAVLFIGIALALVAIQ